MRQKRGGVYVIEDKRRGKWRVEVRRRDREGPASPISFGSEGAKRPTQSFDTKEGAEAVAASLRRQLAGCEQTVHDAIEKYVEDLEAQGMRATHVATTGHRLRSMFTDDAMVVDELEPRVAQGLYDELRARLKTVDTHRNTLGQTRTFCKWLTRKGWLAANPFADVVGVGRRKRGKPQLTIDEARTLTETCLATDDVGATAVLCCLLLGLRASEVAGLSPRAIDDGGRLVRVLVAKTEAGVRLVEVPECLRPRMMALAERESSRYWVRDQCLLWCRRAGVTEVSPHGLRGTHASLATRAGATSQLVAATLGHSSPAVTEAHYTQPGATSSARQRAALQVIDGGRR